MLSNFNKFANLKNILSVTLLYTKHILYTIYLLNTKRYRITEEKLIKSLGKTIVYFSLQQFQAQEIKKYWLTLLKIILDGGK